MYYYTILFLSVISSVLAQLILKVGMRNAEVFQTVPFLHKIATILNPWLFGALFFYGSSFFLYSIVLSKFEVNKVYPISVVAAIVLISLLSVVFLHESLSVMKIAGIIVCIIGIILLLRG